MWGNTACRTLQKRRCEEYMTSLTIRDAAPSSVVPIPRVKDRGRANAVESGDSSGS